MLKCIINFKGFITEIEVKSSGYSLKFRTITEYIFHLFVSIDKRCSVLYFNNLSIFEHSINNMLNFKHLPLFLNTVSNDFDMQLG